MELEKIVSHTYPITKISSLLIIIQSCCVYMRYLAPSQLVLAFPLNAFEVFSKVLAIFHYYFLQGRTEFFNVHKFVLFVFSKVTWHLTLLKAPTCLIDMAISCTFCW